MDKVIYIHENGLSLESIKDSKGNIIREVERRGDHVTYTYDYEYDEAGKRTRSVLKNADGKILETSKYIYDSDGKLIEREFEDDKGNVYGAFKDKTILKRKGEKKSKKSMRKDLKKIMDNLPPPRSEEELRRDYGPAMDHVKSLIHQAFADLRKKEEVKSKKKAPKRMPRITKETTR